MRLRELLRDRLTQDELRLLPSGWNRIGHVALLSLPSGLMEKASEIGEVLLQIRGVRTVAVRTGGITGRERRPKIRLVAGEPKTETIDKEHGCNVNLDVARVMFARGNVYEIYGIYDLPTGEAISKYAKTFIRFGYQRYEYNYSGSMDWNMKPYDLDSSAEVGYLNQVNEMMGRDTVDSADQIYLTFEAYF